MYIIKEPAVFNTIIRDMEFATSAPLTPLPPLTTSLIVLVGLNVLPSAEPPEQILDLQDRLTEAGYEKFKVRFINNQIEIIDVHAFEKGLDKWEKTQKNLAKRVWLAAQTLLEGSEQNLVKEAVRNIKNALANDSTRLNLRDFGLKSLPPEISVLKILKKLDLESNKLTHIPEFIGQLTKLEKLDLSYNRLSRIPDVIGDLKNLRILWLQENDLRGITPQVGRLRQLKKLDVSNNRNLTELPLELANCSNLRFLKADGTRLSGDAVLSILYPPQEEEGGYLQEEEDDYLSVDSESSDSTAKIY